MKARAAPGAHRLTETFDVFQVCPTILGRRTGVLAGSPPLRTRFLRARAATLLPLLLPLLLAGPAIAWVAPGQLHAQEVRGRVFEAGSERPIEGAFVSLVGAGDEAVVSTLSGADGAYVLHVFRGGSYRLRVERIGYETWESEPFQVGRGRVVVRELAVPVAPVRLGALRVEAERRCRARPGAMRGAELARVWEEVRKALEVARWTEERAGVRFELRRFERVVDPETGRIREERSERGVRAGRYSFLSAPAEELAREGYVREVEGEEGMYRYFAPDAEVLLSETFLKGHCFSLVRGTGEEESGWVGLAFRPVERGGPPDVEGTLWVERARGELRRLEFRYVGVRLPAEGAGAGGRVEFARLPGGQWYVRWWRIRMPVARREYREVPSRDLVRPGPGRRVPVERLAFYREVGGEVEGVGLPGGGRQRLAERGSVEGLVWDSVAGGPLAGAEVALVGTAHRARTDGEGRFRLEGVPPGAYDLSFTPPGEGEDAVWEGVLEARPVEVQPGRATRAALALPSPRTLLARLCPEADRGEEARDRRVPAAAAIGVVRSAETGEPVAGARVWFLLSEYALRDRRGVTRISEARTRLGFRTDEEGAFRACGLPGEERLLVQAETDEAASDTVGVYAPRGGLLRLDLELVAGRRPLERLRLPEP